MRFTLFIALLATSFFSFSQIEIGGEENKKEEKVKKKKPKKAIDGSTAVFFHWNLSSSYRSLIENDSPFGDPLEDRSLENPLLKNSFTLGFMSDLKPYLAFEGAISFMSNGEQFKSDRVDTTYTYKSTYRYIGMPLKLRFKTQGKFRFTAAAGLIPKMFIGFKQEQTWESSLSGDGSETIKTKIGYSSFVLSAVFNIGCQIQITERWSFYLEPEYRYQLTSSYMKQDSFKHFNRSLGVNSGFLITL